MIDTSTQDLPFIIYRYLSVSTSWHKVQVGKVCMDQGTHRQCNLMLLTSSRCREHQQHGMADKQADANALLQGSVSHQVTPM